MSQFAIIGLWEFSLEGSFLLHHKAAIAINQRVLVKILRQLYIEIRKFYLEIRKFYLVIWKKLYFELVSKLF